MRIVLMLALPFILQINGNALMGQSSSTQSENGFAVYYADYLDGQSTALGEIYRKDAFTCAHKYHPKGTLLKVTRLDNTRSVIVRVNDRGPYGEGIVVDLSKAAAKQLDMLKTGRARVKLEVIGKSNINPGDDLAGQKPAMSYAAPAPVQDPGTAGSIYGFENRPDYQSKSVETYSETGEYFGMVKKEGDFTSDNAERFAVKGFDRNINTGNSATPVDETKSVTGYDITAKGVGDQLIQRLPAEQTGYAIQMSAFGNYDNAQRQYLEYKGKGLQNVYIMDGVDDDGEPLHRIVVAAFSSEQKAENYLSSIRQVLGYDGLVVKLR